MNATHEEIRFRPVFDEYYPEFDPEKTERLGLFSLGYSILFDNSLYYGVSVFGATTGRRSGFVLPGVQVGYLAPSVFGLRLRSQLFVGGGGGGRTPRGQGLMLRPTTELLFGSANFQPGIGYSRVAFRDSGIDSEQWFLSLTTPSQFAYGEFDHSQYKFHQEVTTKEPLEEHQLRLSSLAKIYVTSGKIKKSEERHGNFAAAIGAAVDSFQTNDLFFRAQVFAPVMGGMAGYMEILAGFGYSYSIGSDFSVEPRLLAGHAGGGNVDAGGGLAAEAALGFRVAVGDSMQIVAEGGYLSTARGEFDVPIFVGGFGYDLVGQRPGSRSDKSRVYEIDEDDEDGDRRRGHTNWSASFGVQRYYDLLPNGDVDFFRYALSYYLNSHFYLIGETSWSFFGPYNSSSYAFASVGLGMKLFQIGPLQTSIEAGAGAASGAALPKDDELLASAALRESWELSNNSLIFIGGGKLKTLRRGYFTVRFVEVGIKFNFGLPYR